MFFSVAGTPLADTPMRIEFYVQHWTGGHCHDDGSRPVAYYPDGHGGLDPLTSLDRTTNANGVVTFSFNAPELASGLNLVAYSLDPLKPFNTQRDTTQRICIRVPDLVDISQPAIPALTFGGAGPPRSGYHPSFRWARSELRSDLEAVAHNYRLLWKGGPDLEVADISLQFGGLLDEQFDQTGLLPSWVPGLCRHRWGMSVDIRPAGIPLEKRGLVMALLSMGLAYKKNFPFIRGLPHKVSLHTGPLSEVRYHLEWSLD